MSVYFKSHRYDPKLKKRVEEKVQPIAKGAIYNLQGQPISPEVRKQEQKIIQSVQDSKKQEV